MIAKPEILKDLTGLQRPRAVCRWLDRQRIPYLPGADGWPRVLETIIIERLGGRSAPTSKEPQLRLRHG